ncbi:MAG: pyroglutamyl-peptidase I [Hyphomicrobiaceae bacterium]
MKSGQPTILITGFGPFPGVPVNVSGPFAEELAIATQRVLAHTSVVAGVLPTEWSRAPRMLEELYFRHRPTIALHFGVSHQAHAMTVECRARNIAQRADASGLMPDLDHLAPARPSELPVTLPAARIVSRMRKRTIPAVLSNDAGAYLCNAILFHSLELMRVMGINGQCGFIHLPTNLARDSRYRGPANAQRLSFEQARVGGCEALATLLRRPAA